MGYVVNMSVENTGLGGNTVTHQQVWLYVCFVCLATIVYMVRLVPPTSSFQFQVSQQQPCPPAARAHAGPLCASLSLSEAVEGHSHALRDTFQPCYNNLGHVPLLAKGGFLQSYFYEGLKWAIFAVLVSIFSQLSRADKSRGLHSQRPLAREKHH